MKTLRGSKTEFVYSIYFIWESTSPRDETIWRDTSVNDTDQIFSRRARSREVYRDKVKKRKNKKKKLWKPWWEDFERLGQKARVIRVSILADTLKGNDAIDGANAAEANISSSIDAVEQNCVHPFHLVNSRTRQSVFWLVFCRQVTITA